MPTVSYTEISDIANSTATTASISPGSTVAGTVSPSYEQDWWQISLNAGTVYTFNLDSAAVGTYAAMSDPYLRLFNSSGTQIAYDDDGGTGLNSLLNHTPSTSGTYYLSAGGFGSSAGGYNLTASGASTDIPASTSTTASITVNGAAVTGVVDISGDTDWYRTTLTAGTTYTLRLNGQTVGSTAANRDVYLRLMDANGTQIAYNDDSGGNMNSLLPYTPTASGTYYLSAGGYSSNTGGYSMTITSGTTLTTTPTTTLTTTTTTPTTTPTTTTTTSSSLTNSSPTATTIDDEYAMVGEEFSFTVPSTTFTDPDGDTLTYTTRNVPSWMTFNATTRTFTGTPTVEDDHSITITARDPGGRSASATLDVFVTEEEENQAPTLSRPLGTYNWREGRTIRYVIPRNSFTDPDGDTLTYSATLRGGRSLPSWLRFNANTRTFRGRAPINGPDLQVQITAEDPDGLNVSGTLTVRTTNGGAKPAGSLLASLGSNQDNASLAMS